jgi:hypothetical protein
MRGEYESGRDHGLVIFASAVLAVLDFPNLPDGVAALRAYGSRPAIKQMRRSRMLLLSLAGAVPLHSCGSSPSKDEDAMPPAMHTRNTRD